MNLVEIPYKYFEKDPFAVPRDKREVGKAFWTVKEHTVKKIMEIFVHCPNCCLWGQLRAHSISEEGVVSPSIWCKCPQTANFTKKDPDWHIFGKLLQWKELIGKSKAANEDLL